MSSPADNSNNTSPEETSDVPAHDGEDEEDIMKLLDMDGLPGDESAAASSHGNSSHGSGESTDENQQEEQGGADEIQNEHFDENYYIEEAKDELDQLPDLDTAQGEGHQQDAQQNNKSEEKKEKPDPNEPPVIGAGDVPEKQKTDPQAETLPKKEPKEEPVDELSAGTDEGQHKVIKVLMKSEEPDPLEALQLHLQKTQEVMAKHQQQQLQHPLPGPQNQAVNHQQVQQQHQQQPLLTQIKQEPGVTSQNATATTQSQQLQQHTMQQQHQQVQQQFRQQQMQMQQQRMPHPQQQQMRGGMGAEVRPPPPLQDMRAQIQMIAGTAPREGPVQCEICHRTFLSERGYLSHRHVHTDAPQPPKPIIHCKTCIARAKFRLACASGKASPGKVDFSAPCTECGSKTIPNLPPGLDTLPMRQVYNNSIRGSGGAGGRQPGPFIVPGTVRTLQQQQQQQNYRGSLQQRMAHQAQRFAGMYRQQGSYSQANHMGRNLNNHSNNSKASSNDDDDIKIVSVTPGRPSHKSPAKSHASNRQERDRLKSSNHGLSPAGKRRHAEENGQSTPTKSSKSDSSTSSSSLNSDAPPKTPEGGGSVSSMRQDDDQNTDGLLDLLVQQKKIYECTHCKILFREFSLYAVHIGMHSSDKPMKCSMCGKDCSSKFEFLCHHSNN